MDLGQIQETIIKGNWVMSCHARQRTGQRCISATDMIVALLTGEILEDYPEDPRGPSCLVLGHIPDGRSIHIVCSLDNDGTLIIITVYIPEPPKWINERSRGNAGGNKDD
ncbi:hypothetical protein MGLY_09220 [Neomoorella glycerini]|uniref:DUF4258 domain-containing protein n=1 Tax=Neomoorella glycerini TaxID=55779 RepID=A0A6I5ZP84_9FIRM|nr:DUF4258 domain-containing protein [Moorella glycerini]QGP91586.1 hypothetical protein MGLY_09220 [Moorella glycerini]